ncbi:MAG: enoyl-CoA hydratase-related protein, partial [Pseudomonadota bacterium]
MLTNEFDDKNIATLTLNRPDVHNAFNAELIGELSSALDELAQQPPRAVIVTGAGKSFSAGADLAWMRGMAEASETENRNDSERLAAMF